MSRYEPSRLAERLLDACLGVALGAAALYAAVWLARQVWPWLLGASLVTALLASLLWWRRRW